MANFPALESQLRRVREDHVQRLHEGMQRDLRTFDAQQPRTFYASLSARHTSISHEINRYLNELKAAVLALADTGVVPMSEDARDATVAAVERSVDPRFYPERLRAHEQSLLREAARCGITNRAWEARTDISEALLHVGAANGLRRTLRDLADELNIRHARALVSASASIRPGGKMLSDLMNDTIDIVKANGTEIHDQKAVVESNRIFMDANRVLVEAGDHIRRRMSNGGQEMFLVIDPCFYEAAHGIPAHYQMRVQKLGIQETREFAAAHTIYNVTGANARINQNSTDNSVNTVAIDSGVAKAIAELRAVFSETAELLPAKKKEAQELVGEIEDSFRTGRPKKSVISALLASLPQIANVATIAALILQALG